MPHARQLIINARRRNSLLKPKNNEAWEKVRLRRKVLYLLWLVVEN